MFALQKIVARMLFPLPVVFWLVVAAGIAAWYRRPRLARRLAVAAVVWLFLISWNPLAEALLGTLERRYAPLADIPAGITHVVVLGGGAHADPGRHAAVRLARSSQGRVLEGVRIWRAAAGSRHTGVPLLLFTGDSPDRRRSMASLAAETARDLGVPPDFIRMLDGTLNTHAEARAVAEFVHERATAAQTAGVVLVTSASHMPRAIALFQRSGIEPIAAPAQYLTDPGGLSSWSLLPDARAVGKTERFVYEVLGLAWMRVGDALRREETGDE